MKATPTTLAGVYVIEPQVFGDRRGWFMESYSQEKLAACGIRNHFVQDNHSYSATKGTLRGLHYQKEPAAQAKIVRCSRGAILDVAVDLRQGSPHYREWIAVELSAQNQRQLFVPRGFAHGFVTLTDDVEVQYKADSYYAPAQEGGILYSDPEIDVDWGPGPFVLSEKDKNAPLLKDCDANFIYREGEA